MANTKGIASLTAEMVLAIIKDERSNVVVAKDYGVSPHTISDVRLGKTHNKLTEEVKKPAQYQDGRKREREEPKQLTPRQKHEIFTMFSKVATKNLAKMYNVSEVVISQFKDEIKSKGKRWKLF